MKSFLVLFLTLFLSFSTATAGFFPTERVLSIGGYQFSQADITRFESDTTGTVLTSHVTTSTRFTSFRTNAAVAYVVPGAATLRCVAMKISAISAATGGGQIGYCSDEATFDDTSCTSITYCAGTYPFPHIGIPATGHGGTAGEIYLGKGCSIPTGKYPIFIAAGGSMSATVYCFID